jgi:hypothetical protein
MYNARAGSDDLRRFLSPARSASFFLWQAPMHHVFQKFVDQLSGSHDPKAM